MVSKNNKLNRPILIVSNSSWYLNHYRSLLIKELIKNYKYVIAISPIDSSTKILSKYILHIPFRIDRSGGLSPLSLLFSVLRMLFIVRALKPSLIHSHTLKANFINSIISSFYGIPIIYSFAGMGRMFLSSRFKRFIFTNILKSIYFFSSIKRVSKFKIKTNQMRCKYIFQNPRDLRFMKNIIKPNKVDLENFLLIPGSGLPSVYIEKEKEIENGWITNSSLKSIPMEIDKIKLIYCGRLIKSKGIYDFNKLTNVLNKNKYYVYGEFDKNSKINNKKNKLKQELENNKNLVLRGNICNPLFNHLDGFPVLLLLSQYGEGLPRTMIEAMSLCIPVIATKIAACELFDEKNIYLLSSNDVKNVEEVLEKLLLDYKEGQLKQKLLDSRDLVKENYSETKIVSDTLKIYSNEIEKEDLDYLNLKDIDNFNLWISN